MKTEKTQHTPGPWKLKRVKREDSEDIAVQAPDGRTYEGRYVALVCTIGANPSGEDNNNARLIAAAPDLLAACVALRDRMLVNTLQNSEDAEAVRLANAAIRKAQREAP